MTDIAVDYLGGDPDQPAAPVPGKLRLDDGAVVFDGQFMSTGLKSVPIAVKVAAGDVRAVSTGDADQMRALTRGAVGVLLGGAIGGIIGMATGRRTVIIAIAVERDGFPFAVMFGATANDARWFATEMQRGRRAAGLPALPRVEDLAGQAAADAADEHTAVLREILAELREQSGLLRDLMRERS